MKGKNCQYSIEYLFVVSYFPKIKVSEAASFVFTGRTMM